MSFCQSKKRSLRLLIYMQTNQLKVLSCWLKLLRVD